MSQLDILSTNIDNLTERILNLKETKRPDGVQIPNLKDNIEKNFLTDRQSAKKMMSELSNSDENEVHLIVYGKKPEMGIDSKIIDNEILYPNCVNKSTAMPDNHPMLDKIRDMKKEVKKSAREFAIKVADLAAEVAQMAITVGSAAAAAVNAIAQVPVPGIAVAFSLLQSMISSIIALINKMMEILPPLQPLLQITYLVASASLDIILVPINAIFTSINVTLDIIENTVLGFINIIKTALQTLS